MSGKGNNFDHFEFWTFRDDEITNFEYIIIRTYKDDFKNRQVRTFI